MTTFDKIKTAAIARLEAGENMKHILQDYADYDEELRPILEDFAQESLGSLARRPKPAPKAKIKAKRASTNLNMPAIAAAIVLVLLLGAVLGAFFMTRQSVSTQVIYVDPTTEPVIVEPTSVSVQVQNVEDACIGLDQQQITSTYNQAPQGQQTAGRDVPVAPDIEVEELSSVASPLPTGTPMPASAPPSLADAGGAGERVDRASVRAESDTAVAAPGEPVVATSVASYDERSVEDSADYVTDGDSGGAEPLVGEAGADESRGRSADDAVAVGGVSSSTANRQVVLEPLRAGEIDDNADWDTYQEYRRNYLNTYGTWQVRDVDTTDRQVIRVVDSNGLPVLGACVQIYVGEYFISASRTYATGLTLFFPNLREDTRYAQSFRVVASKGTVVAQTTLQRDNIGGVTNVELDMTQQQATVQLDILFLLDATGSMGDEIAQLQENILAISAQVDALDTDIDVRFGLVVYRDRTDEYVTRVYDFTSDVNVFQNTLAAVQASGGGDYPESMNAGLDMALNAVSWRGENTIKLVFLVADAPPHIDYPNDADYSLLMQSALARGIKIHPIASSGLQPEGEFIMRQLGQFTMGHFIFLTYEGGTPGTAGDDRPDLAVGDPRDEQGIGDYSVAQLDELVLRLITDEINALNGD